MTPLELYQRRLALGLTQKALADALGVHRNLTYRWECGIAKIPPYLHLALERLEQKGRAKRPKP